MKRIYSIPCSSSMTSIDPLQFKWQNKKSKYLAVTADNIVNIYNRHGEHVDQINLFGYCTSMCWDEEGDCLAIITNRSPLIFLWDAITHKLEQIDSSMKETLSIISWSKMSSPSTLFVGTIKGNILLYNNQTSRKYPIYGKHNKKIISCCWSDAQANLLALVGEDRILTVNNQDCDTLSINHLKGEGSNVKFFHSYQEENKNSSSNESNSVAVILNKRMLYMMNINDSENSFILNFKDWYENIVDYYCYPTGNIFIAFTSGLIVTISTAYKNFGVELFQIKAHRDSLSAFSVCPNTNRIASCDENNIKIFDLYDHNDIENVFIVDDEPSIVNVDWTNDGQLLALCSSSGNIHVYLSQLKIIGDSYGTSLAFLSSLLEVTVFNVHEEVQDSVMIIRIEIEPSRIAVGPFHLAVVMNNKVWIYSIVGNELMNVLINECEYTGIIKDLKLNSTYMAILFTNGTLQFHPIEQQNHNKNNDFPVSNHDSGGGGGGAELFTYFTYPDGNEQPHKSKKNNVTSLCLTNDFIIYALENGSIIYFIIEDWNYSTIYRHQDSIQMIQSNLNGTKIIIMDQRNEAYVYNVYNETLIKICADHVPSKPLKILWESWIHDRCVFTICDNKFIYVYSTPCDTIEGPKVDYVGKMKIPSGQFPLLLYNGVVVCQTKSGKTSNFVLSTHDYAIKNNNNNNSNSVHTFQKEVFENIIKLRRYQDAIKICNFLDDSDLWLEIGRSAIKDLEINVAIRVYRQMHKYAIVYCLEKYRHEEEQSLLCGLLAEMIAEYDLAQKHFLNSSKPLYALEMRKNLQHWNEALALARHLSPSDVPSICRELAIHQEYLQEYQKALENFETALAEYSSKQQDADDKNSNNHHHLQLCYAGIARNSIRCGNLKKALTIASNLEEMSLIKECAFILEQYSHLQEAAIFYEKCSLYDQAASLYLKVKNSSKLASIITRISDSNVLCQYGKIKEMEGQYRMAAETYLKAGKWEDVVRINLDHLNNPGEAVKVVREKHSVEGAKLVARFFQKLNDMSAAIEFLIMSKCYEDAYNLALTTKQMDIYADIMQYHVDEEKNLQDFRTIAIYYDQENNLFKAGKYYCIAQMYKKGVKLLLESVTGRGNGEEMDNEALSLAIDAAAKAKDEQITRMILDFLMGETDGIPRDFKFLFRLYMKMKLYQEAAKTALIIAKEEQNSGNYRNAHQLLFSMCSELKQNNISIPSEMAFNLMLVHSYMLAKIWIRIGGHKISSKLLIRVYDNINQFPAHSVQILTFIVIECLRAGYHRNALKFAYILMKPENREKIDLKLKKKIENLVRKSSRNTSRTTQEELQEELNIDSHACPFCSEMVQDFEFSCHHCRCWIPFCIASGMHIRKDELTKCNNCHFPAIRTYLVELLSEKLQMSLCPMCGQKIDLNQMEEEQQQGSSYQIQDVFNLSPL